MNARRNPAAGASGGANDSLLLINDLERHTSRIRTMLDTAIGRVLDRGWFVHGPELEKFEHAFAEYCGTETCVGVGNGTDALELALRAAGTKHESRVATVANAGMYGTAAILACGAHPVYIDIDPATLNMNAGELAKSASSIDAVIVTHLYGRMAPMPEILAAAGKVPVIEDCAQAHGAVLGDRRAGSWGLAGCFSFYPTKNLGAAGDGGAVVTSNASVAKAVTALRQYGWKSKYSASVPHGRNSRLDELQAAVLSAKLPLLAGWNDRRREIAKQYRLSKRPSCPADVAHLYVVRSAYRDEIRAGLRSHGIAAEIHYAIPDYCQEAVRAVIGETPRLPFTESACAEVLTLPCFPEMSDEEVQGVLRALDCLKVETGRSLAESL